MSEPSKRKTICAICEKDITLSNDILLDGCPNCGSFKFKTFKEGNIKFQDEKELDIIVEREVENTDIQEGLESIRLTSEGVFEVDIEKLLTESGKEKTIISRDKDGSYFIKFTTKEEQN